jgi:CRISPR/Cas system CSM-associated protein Csm3 (group 7 of RAMP superfamily)
LDQKQISYRTPCGQIKREDKTLLQATRNTSRQKNKQRKNWEKNKKKDYMYKNKNKNKNPKVEATLERKAAGRKLAGTQGHSRSRWRWTQMEPKNLLVGHATKWV